MTTVQVVAPASSANFGPGFDVFALALRGPSDSLTLKAGDSRSSRLELRSLGRSVPSQVAKNSATAVASRIANDFEIKSGLSLTLKKGVPVGVGLGSSAASSVAAAAAMNELFALKLGISELLMYAGEGEAVSSGTPHYDNVAASLMGGFVIVRKGSRPSATRFEAPDSLVLCLATPKVDLPERKTEFARSILPEKVELEKLVHNVSMASSIVSGFAKGDIEAIGLGMNDAVVEPVRSRLVPGYALARERAIDAGASGVCISGAGPTMLAVVDGRKTKGSTVVKAMIEAFRKSGHPATGFVTRAGGGARVVRK